MQRMEGNLTATLRAAHRSHRPHPDGGCAGPQSARHRRDQLPLHLQTLDEIGYDGLDRLRIQTGCRIPRSRSPGCATGDTGRSLERFEAERQRERSQTMAETSRIHRSGNHGKADGAQPHEGGVRAGRPQPESWRRSTSWLAKARFRGASPREVAAQVKTVITMLPDSPDVRDVVFGEDGLLEAMGEGQPADRHEHHLAGDCARGRGGAARQRSPRAGRAGQRRRQGSDRRNAQHHGRRAAEDFERAKPLFEVMGKTIVHVGGAGAGQTVKACNQIVVALTFAAVSEALVLGSKAGVDPRKIVQVLVGRSRRQQGDGATWRIDDRAQLPARVSRQSASQGPGHRARERARATTWRCR